MTDDQGCRSLPPPPPNLPRARRTAGLDIGGDPPHFWRGGPAVAVKLARPRRVRARDGKRRPVTHEVRWCLERVAGVSRSQAIRRIHDVVLDPHGWLQCGVHWKRVSRREQATIIVRVIPAAETVCGANSAGCFSWGFEADRKPAAEMGVEYIDNDPAWKVITGMELCAHPLALEDHYTAQHQPYLGVLGTWESAAAVGYVPTRAEIAAARAWLDGTLDPKWVHH